MLTIRALKTPLIGPIDLTLEPGMCTAIAGPSGAGKSLLLRAIADLDENTGLVALNGMDRSSVPASSWRRKIACVPAESGWWAERVGDHFAPSPGLRDRLESVGLADALPWQVSRLSSGERQRLALVRALETEPQVLLLDEPTSALDPASVERVETLLKGLLAKGLSLLLVSHDPSQPGRLDAKCLRMERGRLASDTRSEVAL
ncbi:ABC transporter ATP-binding protein [Roseibium sp. M-1]